jgi:hypothetical protein
MTKGQLIALATEFEQTMGYYESSRERATLEKLIRIAETLRQYGINANPYDPDDETVGAWIADNVPTWPN